MNCNYFKIILKLNKVEYGKNLLLKGLPVIYNKSGATLTIYERKGITIGNNTLIGGNVKIIDNDFHPIEIETRNQDIKEKIRTRIIIIGKNCFIGCNSIILKGTSLGDGVVVGAGSVVSGQFPDNVVIAGNPAKIINHLE